MLPLDVAPLQGDAASAARWLLGALLVRVLEDGTVLSGRIVETEAYDQHDPASHTYRGRTKRNAAMFGPAGRAYVYLSYGMHWCLNVTAGQSGFGAGVLLRGLEPLEGVSVMESLRGGARGRLLTNGPGKLAQALAVTDALYGHDLTLPPLQLFGGGRVPQRDTVTTTRIGLSRGAEAPLRFFIRDSPWVSRKAPLLN